MRINKIFRVEAVAKRDADLDAEYEEAMEEIESMKKKCKALEYGTHTTGLITNLIGDIPDIPLVTDKAKKIAAGVSAVAHVAEYGMNIASTAMECDDWNFEEIKAIMEKRFSEIDRKLDRMAQAVEKVTKMVTETLYGVEKTREEMKWGFKNILATLKNLKIQSILSKINKFSRYFQEKQDEIGRLPADQFLFRLKEKDGILDFLKKVRLPEGLHSDLFDLMDKNNNFAIPENADDSKAFQALYALFYGTQTYAAVMFFLLKQHCYLVDFYYQNGKDAQFNDQITLLITTFNEFKTSLTGDRGLINNVIKTLDEVKDKVFIPDVKNELYVDISKRVNTLKELKSKIAGMVLNVIEDMPQPVDNIGFSVVSVIPSNYGDWDEKAKVSYAVQLRKDGAYSKFSRWSEPMKVENQANPVVTVPRDEQGRERLIFRKFNENKPELAYILTKSQVEFRDVDRDLYDAAGSRDQMKALEYIPKLLEGGAHINAVFETKRSIMHAAAESGNVKIAMRYLIDETQDDLLNAKDEKGFTPLHVAAGTKNAGFVNFLITLKANVNVQTNSDSLTPLHIASKKGFQNAVKHLLAAEKIEINQQEKSGYTPLHFAVRGTPKTIKLLLDQENILVNAKSNFGLTPFHLAIMKGDRDICDALLSSGKVDVNAGNKDNLTPLHFAAMEGNIDMIQYLLSGKKEVEEVNISAVTSDNNWTPLYVSLYFKQEDAALEFLKNSRIDISISSKENVTPLQLSVATGQMKVFDEILNKDSNPDAVSKDGFTALHLAALRPETNFTAKLLVKNANIDAKTDDGSTPLHLASKSDNTNQIILLINQGANMKLYDKKELLPFQHFIKNVNLEAMRAAVNKDPSIVDFFTDEGLAIGKYCYNYIFSKIYDYYDNKDSIQFQKYKDLPPLEVFNKMGYYEILRIVTNDPLADILVNSIMETINKGVRMCFEREEKTNETPCNFTSIRMKRNFESIELTKLQPTHFSTNSGSTSKNLNSKSSFDAKLADDRNHFPNVKNSFGQNIDTNGILLLMDLFVRKFTNEKYKWNVKEPLSTLESQAEALKITEKFSEFVDSVSDVPAEELVDLAKLHSDIYKSIEGGNSNIILNILCEQMKSILNPEQMEAFFSDLVTNDPGGASEKQNPLNTVAQHCLSETKKGNTNSWLHIYTDGSRLEIDDVAGAGIYCEHFSHYLSLGTAKTASDDEVEAIKVALTHLNARPSLFDQAVIISDSQAAILAIANCFQAPSSFSIVKCRSLMTEIEHDVYRWLETIKTKVRISLDHSVGELKKVKPNSLSLEMRINQTAVTLAIVKRDSDNDPDSEYETAMEEIESRKKTCKALEYAGHATGLVTDLIGDIPEIPLVTDGAKIVTSGIAAIAHVAEFGMNIAATAMECDDVNFDEIKLIMDKRFNEVDRKLDKMTEAMEKVTEMVTKTLTTVEQTRVDMKWGFKTVLKTLRNSEIQTILFKIKDFSRYFEKSRNEISILPAYQFVFRLKQKDGILDYLKKVRMPRGLHSYLFELMDKNNNFAIPKEADDSKAFQALYALFYGTQTYVSIMFFLLKQHSYLADYYYQRGQDKEFNEEFDILATTFSEFKASLTGTNGLINEVVKTLEDVKNKYFISDVNNELYADISKRIDGLTDLKTNISQMTLTVIEDTPEPVIDIDFNKPDIASNYGDWDDKSRVRYAVQLRMDGTYSKFSEWTEPLKVDGKANPTLHISRDEKGRERLVFRKFNEEKPQLVGILRKSQTELRDIDRDLYDAARSKDQTKPLQYIPILLEAGANMTAVFERKRNIMHAAAESGNVKIAMRFLLDVKKELFDASDEKGYTAMHVAASTKNAGFVSFLLTHDANVNAQTNLDKLTALHIAAKKGYFKTVKNLLSSNKIEINIPEKSGYTPLHYAVQGTSKTLKLLLDDDKILVNAKSDFGLTPFHLAVMKGDRRICDALLSSGKVEVNAGNINNMTPLHFAAMAGNVDMIQYLLSGKDEVKEVNINVVTSDNNWTPLYSAVYFKQESAVLELLKYEKTDLTIPSKENYTPLHLSVATGQMNVFDELLKKGSNIESLTKEKFTALHLAAFRSEKDFTAKLLDKNANINAISDDGSTPLHLAAKADRTDQMLLLINGGADMKLYDSKNFLPLQYAIKNMNLKTIEAAVNKDPSIVDGNSKEGKIIMKYSVDFIFASTYHYHKNKDFVEYEEYKDFLPLEVFQKLGYFDLLKIVANDPKAEVSINQTIATADKLGEWCVKKEKDPEATHCKIIDVRSRRNIEAHDSYTYQPKYFLRNASTNSKIIGNSNSLSANPSRDYKSFSQSGSSMVQDIDTNGMLLLFDILVRKFTNEKYNLSADKPITTLESQAAALEVIDKFSAFVDSVSDVPTEELIDLAKLHSEVYKSLESGNSNMIYYLLCQHLRDIAEADQVATFLSSIKIDNGDQSQENSIKTLVQYCLTEADEGTTF
ncbi:uncharacterized protein [Parasteatoda tepidariorum]|uniref:uncharacterized protein n=1 Tax=Parasteatoda tepidariorum TaxID=114398 RepID=UPI0039BC8026